MHFFEKQKYDDAGIIGVKIQKLLVLLMIARIVAYLFSWNMNLFNVVSTFAGFLFFFVGFWGAYKRNVRMLQCYYITNVLIIVGSAVLVAFVVVPMLLQGPNQPDYSVNDPAYNSTVPDASVLPNGQPDESNTTQTNTNSGATNDTDSNSNFNSDDSVHYQHFSAFGGAMILIVGIISIALFVLRIVTMILAAKMARLLKEKQTHSLAHPVKANQSYHPMTEIMPNTMYIQVPIQPNTVPFEYYPHQFAQQPMVFNPYLQPYRPQNV